MGQTEEKQNVSQESATPSTTFDLSKDVVLTDDDGERIAAMRDYVFMNLVTSVN